MPKEINVTSSITLDEIKEQLINNLSPKQLAEFIVEILDGMSEGNDQCWAQMQKAMKQLSPIWAQARRDLDQRGE